MLARSRRDVLDLLPLRDCIADSRGTALQDVAAAVAVYEKARTLGRGTEVKLDD